jgi:hypothetical protein
VVLSIDGSSFEYISLNVINYASTRQVPPFVFAASIIINAPSLDVEVAARAYPCPEKEMASFGRPPGQISSKPKPYTSRKLAFEF